MLVTFKHYIAENALSNEYKLEYKLQNAEFRGGDRIQCLTFGRNIYSGDVNINTHQFLAFSNGLILSDFWHVY